MGQFNIADAVNTANGVANLIKGPDASQRLGGEIGEQQRDATNVLDVREAQGLLNGAKRHGENLGVTRQEDGRYSLNVTDRNGVTSYAHDMRLAPEAVALFEQAGMLPRQAAPAAAPPIPGDLNALLDNDKGRGDGKPLTAAAKLQAMPHVSPAEPSLRSNDIPSNLGQNDSKNIQNALGAPVRDIPVGAMGNGHTPVISVPGMTPALATKFIDDVLVPMRTSMGINKSDLSFSEGSGKQVLSQQVNPNEVVVSASQKGIRALSEHAEEIKPLVQKFMAEHGLNGVAATKSVAAAPAESPHPKPAAATVASPAPEAKQVAQTAAQRPENRNHDTHQQLGSPAAQVTAHEKAGHAPAAAKETKAANTQNFFTDIYSKIEPAPTAPAPIAPFSPDIAGSPEYAASQAQAPKPAQAAAKPAKPEVTFAPLQIAGEQEMVRQIAQTVYDQRDQKYAAQAVDNFLEQHHVKVAGKGDGKISEAEREALGKLMLDPKLKEDIKQLASTLNFTGADISEQPKAPSSTPSAKPVTQQAAGAGR